MFRARNGTHVIGRTLRFKTPAWSWASVSRASSLWPTSSNASVASWPATSNKTSSPPLEARKSESVSFLPSACEGLRMGKNWHGHGFPSSKEETTNVRVLVDEFAGVVDLIVNHDEDVLLGVVLRNILIRVLLVC